MAKITSSIIINKINYSDEFKKKCKLLRKTEIHYQEEIPGIKEKNISRIPNLKYIEIEFIDIDGLIVNMKYNPDINFIDPEELRKEVEKLLIKGLNI